MLLELPSTFRRPDLNDAGKEIEMACDWIEASVLFSSEPISALTVGDFLIESQWFSDQEDSGVFVDEVWSRLRARREERGASAAFDFDYQAIRMTASNWDESPSYVFCLLLSYARHHLKWSRKITWNYNEQGAIFEALTAVALESIFPDWTVHQTGWSESTPSHLEKVVTEVAGRLCGQVKNLERWNRRQAKEQGLDILCYREFSDGRGSFPSFFVQCASGRNFEEKLSDPHMGVWNDLLSLTPACLARKAFASPFMFSRREFDQHTIKSEGFFLDGQRLLTATSREQGRLNSALSNRVARWAKPLISKLPWSR